MNVILRALMIAAVLAAFLSAAQAQGPPASTGYPSGAQPFWANATGTTSATLTLTAPTGQRVWICGLTASELAGTGQTASGTITNMTGPSGAATTINFQLSGSMAAANVSSYFNDLIPCLPAIAGQSVVVTTPTSTAATSTVLTVQGYFY